MPDPVETWLQALEARHLADLRFPEVTRALRALSSGYVERRRRLAAGAPLHGAGKRAAFALYYGPLHFLMTREIVRALGATDEVVRPIVDLGCGTGVAGAAWALEFPRPPRLVSVDRHPWAIAEAAWTSRALGLHAQTVRNDVGRHRLPGAGAAVIAAYCLNELDPAGRARMRERFADAAGRGARILVIEPIAGPVVPEWRDWAAEVERAGGRADEWRVSPDLPDIVRRLARAAGLHPHPLTARSLWFEPGTRRA
jgi:hypothetical protein